MQIRKNIYKTHLFYKINISPFNSLFLLVYRFRHLLMCDVLFYPRILIIYYISNLLINYYSDINVSCYYKMSYVRCLIHIKSILYIKK